MVVKTVCCSVWQCPRCLSSTILSEKLAEKGITGEAVWAFSQVHISVFYIPTSPLPPTVEGCLTFQWGLALPMRRQWGIPTFQ